MQNPAKLTRKFYTRNVNVVAKELLGKIFVHKTNSITYSGYIVEVEAYDGTCDEAAHTFNGKTNRNKIMFEKGGFFYVYFTYGSHFCCNIVTGKKNGGQAVLIRGIEPIENIEAMYNNRFGTKIIDKKKIKNLTNGPGKICKAFEINKEHYGLDLLGDEVFLLKQKKIKDDNIVETTRIGIKKSTELKWRYYIKNNPYVSVK